MDYLLRRLAAIAVRRGIGAGHRWWFALALGALLLARARRREHPVIASWAISPGEKVVVQLHHPDDPAAPGRHGASG